jgi:hypothetical protein
MAGKYSLASYAGVCQASELAADRVLRNVGTPKTEWWGSWQRSDGCWPRILAGMVRKGMLLLERKSGLNSSARAATATPVAPCSLQLTQVAAAVLC